MSEYNYYEKPKNKLFFDIETLPANEENKDVAIQLTLQKLVTKNGKTKVTKKLKDFVYRQTAISGDFGQILCIGYAINDQKVEIISGDEAEILKTWWGIANQADLFVGHNIMDFDLRFIYKRSIVHKIKPCAKHLNLSFARYRNYPIYDTMREWEKWSQSYVKLDTLAKIFNLESSKTGGIDGAHVYDFYLKGENEKIYEYCKKDVILTREVYRRMVFEDN